MLFAALILALAFYAGIVVGMTHVAAGSGGNHNTEAASAACPPCTDTASSQAQQQQGATDAQIESIVEKRVEVGKMFHVCFCRSFTR
jgi:type IV secretory pathway VirB6-like protein